MEIDLTHIITGICGTTISLALASVARGLNKLNVEVATLNAQVGQIRVDLDIIKVNYVSHASFSERVGRLEKDMNNIGSKLDRVHDEHLSCPACAAVQKD